MTQTVLAVDLGASSGRVMAVTLEGGRLRESVVHRFANGGIRDAAGSLRWDWERLIGEVRTGLDMAAADASSIGIDTWGVDYGLLDAKGALVATPMSYRDERTSGWRATIDKIGAERVYGISGIQLMAPNTLCQLAVHDRAELDRAEQILLMPELIVHALTGVRSAELTSASTTQLLDARARAYSPQLCEAIGIDAGLFAPIQPAGTEVGTYAGVGVRLVGGHDTASAVAAVPYSGGAFPAYLSSGTWSLLGVEQSEPSLGAAAFEANFTNEAGVLGNIRFLRNVMGLWMLDECRREWGDLDIESALALGAAEPNATQIVDAMDEVFLNPPSMEAAIRGAAPGLADGRGAVVACVLHSLADAYRRVVDQLTEVAGRRPDVIHVVGGGCRNTALNDLTSQACGIPVVAGPVEATALGNAVVQMIALGWLSGLDEAREVIRAS